MGAGQNVADALAKVLGAVAKIVAAQDAMAAALASIPSWERALIPADIASALTGISADLADAIASLDLAAAALPVPPTHTIPNITLI